MLLFTHITKYSQILQACFQFPALPIHLQHTALGVCLYLQVFSVPGKVNLAVCYRKGAVETVEEFSVRLQLECLSANCGELQAHKIFRQKIDGACGQAWQRLLPKRSPYMSYCSSTGALGSNSSQKVTAPRSSMPPQ